MKLAAAALAVLLCAFSPAQAQTAVDAETLMECVDAKAGPEGDLPPPGPIRDQIVTAMAGGPQACVGSFLRRA